MRSLSNFNNGDNTFQKLVIANDEEYEVAVLGDISGDGLPDIVYSGEFTYLSINNGDNSFTTTSQELTGTDEQILLNDLDGDNDLDIIIPADSLFIFKNNDGSFLDLASQAIDLEAHVVCADDLNNDGRNELVTFSPTDEVFQINIIENDGNGNFINPPITVASFSRPTVYTVPTPQIMQNNLSLYDFDQDNRLDIIYIDGYSDPNGIMLLRNSTLTSTTILQPEKSAIRLYPNPASEYLNFETELSTIAQFEIVNAIGQIVYSGKTTENRIDIHQLKAGHYTLVLKTKNQGGEISTESFVKL
ncbi:MAG: T9SS type A sorting domain-containing protein [Bacteroidota bacterium]